MLCAAYQAIRGLTRKVREPPRKRVKSLIHGTILPRQPETSALTGGSLDRLVRIQVSRPHPFLDQATGPIVLRQSAPRPRTDAAHRPAGRRAHPDMRTSQSSRPWFPVSGSPANRACTTSSHHRHGPPPPRVAERMQSEYLVNIANVGDERRPDDVYRSTRPGTPSSARSKRALFWRFAPSPC